MISIAQPERARLYNSGILKPMAGSIKSRLPSFSSSFKCSPLSKVASQTIQFLVIKSGFIFPGPKGSICPIKRPNFGNSFGFSVGRKISSKLISVSTVIRKKRLIIA